MPLCDQGRGYIAARLVGEAAPALDDHHAYLGVGDSAAPFDSRQSDLQADANSCRKAIDATFPVRDRTLVTLAATFGPDEANFAWREWGVFSAATGGVMLCRSVAGLGVKHRGETWRLQVEVDLS